MSNLFEDYREIDNVRDRLDFLIDLVNSAPRRVFLTEKGDVRAIIIGPEDYEDLWNIELDRDMKLADEQVARGEVYSWEEVRQHMKDLAAKLQAEKQ
jgi:PHD/YefM family antitoxin component YafN of YafNO toxin-antitoxin module